MDRFYPEALEEINSPHCPDPRSPRVKLTVYVDVDHAGNVLTGRLHIGIIHYINNYPISWFSKRQTTVEGFTFGSEFNALRIVIDQTVSMQYKLRMMGIRVEGPAIVLCDNMSVVIDSTRPESTFKRKV